MDLLNLSQPLGIIIARGTETVTGGVVATFFVIILFLLVLCAMFSIPFEFSAILILPLCIAISAFYTSFLLLVILIALYAAALIANHFIIR